MITLTKKQLPSIAILTVVATIMFAGSPALGTNQAFAFGGGFFHHGGFGFHHHGFGGFGFGLHHSFFHHHFWGWNNCWC